MSLSYEAIRTAATTAERAAGSHVIPWRRRTDDFSMRREKVALSSGCKLRPAKLQPEATEADMDATNGQAG
jgi:hypothetical protein